MSFLTAEYDYDMDIKVNREEAFEAGEVKGLEKGIEQSDINNIISLMDSLDCDTEKAMELLKIPEEKRKLYKTKIESLNQ
ncbi:MAG: hypothetical protein J5476_12540 [Lachnospiraceae bacterium]|nr:hypothetical protein [Lachnospiraceae bacterium]